MSRLIGATEDAEQVAAVVLDDGTELAADLVIESIGSHTNTEWLQGNGLDLTDGVLCDNQLRVEGRAEIVAAGDIARFPNPRFDDIARRVEHWNMPGRRPSVPLSPWPTTSQVTPPPRTLSRRCQPSGAISSACVCRVSDLPVSPTLRLSNMVRSTIWTAVW